MNIKAVRDYLTYGTGQLINLISPLLVAPFVISKCGIENWGKVGVAISIYTLLGLFIDFGSNLIGVKEISVSKMDPDKIRNYLNATFSFKFIVLLLLLLVSCLFIFNIEEWKLYLFGLTMLSSQFFNITWVYQGLGKFSSINMLIFFSKIIYIILVFVFIRKSNDYVLVLFFLGISNSLVYSYYFYKLAKDYKLALSITNLSSIRENIKNEYSILISNISISIYVQSPIIIIQYLLGDYYAGIYKIGDMVLSIFRSYLGVFFNVSFPKFCALYNENKNKGITFLKKINVINFSLLLFGVLFIFASGTYWIPFFEKTRKIADLMHFYVWFLFVPLVIAINIPFYQFLIFRNQQLALSKITSLCSVSMVFICYLLTSKFKLIGGLISVFLVEAIISFLIILYCCVKYKINFKSSRVKWKNPI